METDRGQKQRSGKRTRERERKKQTNESFPFSV